MHELKLALTYNQQIDRLKNVHNLSITDDAAALEILKNMMKLYHLSGLSVELFLMIGF